MVLAVVTALAGCAAGDEQRVATMTLSVPDRAPVEVHLPGRLDGPGLVPDRPLRYELRARVALAPALVGRELDLVLPALAARAVARADGEPLVDRGATWVGGYRGRPPLAWAIPARLTADGHVDVVVEVDHTWTQSAWISAPPRLVPAAAALGRAAWVDLVNFPLAIAGFITIVSIGLSLLWTFYIDRTRRAGLYFGIQALTASVYPAHVAGLLVPLGRFEAPVMTSGICVAITAALYYTSEFFALPRPSRLWRWALGGVLVVFWLGSDPFVFTRWGGRLTVAYVVAGMVAISAASVRLLRARGGREPWMYLATWASLEVAGIPDFLYWATGIDLLGGARTAVIAFFIFPLLLELLLNQQHIGSLNDANAQLAGRVRELEARRGEIEQLNDELRRQISDRAAQIYAALALARQAGGAARELATGEVVQGRYRVERPLGAGGMGTVYEVTRLADGRRLALKLARELHGEALARLAREAQTASTVANPHVVTIVDVDVASSGFLYIVMELVDGEPLGAARGRAGDRTWALRVLAQIADGLAALHRAGVIHRDLKPGNVLLARGADGRPLVKITDFGIALPEGDSQPDVTRSLGPPTPSAPPAPPPTTVAEAPAAEVTGATAPSPAPPQLPSGPRGGTPPGAAGQARAHAGALTRTGFLPGTPSYIAPELADGRHHLSVAADIFSFGVIAHELLVGRRPFAEPPVLARLEGRPVPPPPALAGLCDGIEADVARLLDACLAFEPGARPTAERLAGTLAAVAAAAA